VKNKIKLIKCTLDHLINSININNRLEFTGKSDLIYAIKTYAHGYRCYNPLTQESYRSYCKTDLKEFLIEEETINFILISEEYQDIKHIRLIKNNNSMKKFIINGLYWAACTAVMIALDHFFTAPNYISWGIGCVMGYCWSEIFDKK